MYHHFLALLAVFWAWATVRYVFETYAGAAFYATRAVHPLVVAAISLGILWPDWLAGIAVASAAGLLTAFVDRFFGVTSSAPVQLPRDRRRGGLPSLP